MRGPRGGSAAISGGVAPSSDHVVFTPAPVLSEADRVSGPHSAALALTADKLPAAQHRTLPKLREIGSPHIPERPTLGELLQAPTRWRRSPWVAAWVVLALSLGGLIVKVSSFRAPALSVACFACCRPPVPRPQPPRRSPRRLCLRCRLLMSCFRRHRLPSFVATRRRPSPPPVAIVPSSPPAASCLVAAANSCTGSRSGSPRGERSAAASPPPELDESTKKSLLKRGLGLLTVHSTASHASVYVNLKLFGGPEERLTVPCGKQFVSIGVPPRRPGPPIWLAPGKSIIVPCGGAYEATMNPRALR